MLGCCQFRLKTIRESDFSYRSATEYLFLPLWRDFLCTLPSGYWHMCENLLAEFFSSLFRDICIKTYWLCPSSFFLWDICTETYWLCPSSFARWDITEQKFSICPQTKKITLFHQSQYKITAIKSYFCSSTDFRSL